MSDIEDNLIKDLTEIIKDSRDQSNEIDEKTLMMKLTSYCVRRDHKIWNHAVKIGRDKAIAELDK